MKENRKPSTRRIETADLRAERLANLKDEIKDRQRVESEALDASVRRSIALHGA
jgi:hypothetical protein